MRIEEIPIKDLKVSEFNVRSNLGDLTDLKNSIDIQGLLQPIVVRPVDGELEVVVGQRRFLSCKELGWDTIPAVKRELSDREALTLSLTENVQMDTLDPIDRATGTDNLIKAYQADMSRMEAVDTVAKELGKSDRTVRKWLRLLDTTEAVRAMVRRKEIDTDTGARISSLPREVQEETARVIGGEGITRKQAAKVISRKKREPSTPTEEILYEETEEYSVTVSFRGSLYKRVSDFAREKEQTVQEIIRRAVERYLEK